MTALSTSIWRLIRASWRRRSGWSMLLAMTTLGAPLRSQVCFVDLGMLSSEKSVASPELTMASRILWSYVLRFAEAT